MPSSKSSKSLTEKATYCIGIDLGTTYSCAAVFRDGHVEIIPNEHGNHTTPSCVAFTDAQRFVGEDAQMQMNINPSNTITDAKRLIGRRFDDPVVQQDMRMWAFDVVEENSKPKIQVEYHGEIRRFFPEEISSMVLAKMKAIAEKHLGTSVSNAVITVPAYFNDAQRQATKDAGTIAGFNVQRIVNEPTAAAIAYGLDKKGDDEKKILIFDMGGGTFDVSILSLNEGIFEVLSTSGDTHLGGEDIDNRMMQFFIEEFRRKYKLDLAENKRSLRRLHAATEELKRSLSTETQATIDLDSLFNGVDFYSVVTRTKFEEICADIFRSTLQPVENALRDAKLSKAEINEIVLVGGSTRIPKIQDLLVKMFNGLALNKSINPDEAVAYGAAVQAAIISGDESAIVKDVLLLDVAPLSLGIETVGGVMTVVIARNSTIPRTETKIFSTFADNQTAVLIQIYEGERVLTKDNNLLGKFELTGFPAAPRGSAQIEVSFDLDSNGILSVSAIERASRKRNDIVITNDKGRLTQEQIAQMVADAEQFREEDEVTRQRVNSRAALEQYITQIRNFNASDTHREHLTGEESAILEDRTNEAMEWIQQNENTAPEEFEQRLNLLETQCTTILLRLFAAGLFPSSTITDRQFASNNVEATATNIDKTPSSDSDSGPKINRTD